MSRHRKIDVRMWGDAKFRALSAPTPCAQFLWIYLITGPHTTNLPGLFHIGEAALAEALGWELEAFREAFRELSAKGLVEADWKSRVVYVPNAIRYNEPESPNVVIHWRHSWDEMPECRLKDKAQVNYQQYVIGKGKAFQEAFRKVFGEGATKYPIGSKLNPSPNQEQEQEQEQELFSPVKPASKADAKPTGKDMPRTPSDRDSETAPTASRPENASAKKPRERNELFDAIAAVTGSDPVASATHIGRVCKALRAADPPYTPVEVRALPAAIQAQGLDFTITLGSVEKYIGWVRHPPSKPGQSVPAAESLEEKNARILREREQSQREAANCLPPAEAADRLKKLTSKIGKPHES